jgi:cyclopropane-fatty-acyl-phospholipid synthase
MNISANVSHALLKTGLIPDALIRRTIRGRLKETLRIESDRPLETFVEMLRQSPIAVNTADANAQHYELPTAFFQLVLGSRLKYSSGLWKSAAAAELDGSEVEMLALTTQRAELMDGGNILELGCGWGSLTLYMAEFFPHANITAVSNSRTQREFIVSEAERRGFRNVNVVTADMNDFDPTDRFDRIVSVEMFEHMRNYQELLRRISSWLNPQGKLFVHIFAHRELAYLYEARDESDWMARYFFAGGIMPSEHLLSHFQSDMVIEQQWRVDGTHYQKTCEAWLKRMDAARNEIMPIFRKVYGNNAGTWWIYWRVFFMACAELFGYENGQEWFVSHTRWHRT